MNASLQDQLCESLQGRRSLITLHQKQLAKLTTELSNSKQEVLLAIKAAQEVEGDKKRILLMHKNKLKAIQNEDHSGEEIIKVMEKMAGLETELLLKSTENDALKGRIGTVEIGLIESEKKRNEAEEVVSKLANIEDAHSKLVKEIRGLKEELDEERTKAFIEKDESRNINLGGAKPIENYTWSMFVRRSWTKVVDFDITGLRSEVPL